MNVLDEPRLQKPCPSSADTASCPDLLPELTQLFRLLADETRLRIIRLLVESEEYHVRALCNVLGQSQPAVSHHLALLRTAGLIECRRQGKHNFYHLTPGKFEEVLDLVFAGKPAGDRRVRVGKYMLSCSE